jgi:hypothetical protein
MDQVSGSAVFVADHPAADHLSGRAVQLGQSRQAVSGQHPVHGGRVQAEQIRDAGWAPPTREADLDDPPLDLGRGTSRTVMRAAGAIDHAGRAQFAVAHCQRRAVVIATWNRSAARLDDQP